MRDRQAWLRHSKELIHICEAIREGLYGDLEEDPIGRIVSAMLQKGVRTFRAIRLLYMNGLEEQAQALVRVLFETMVDLNMFVFKVSENQKAAIKRVLDAMMLQKVQQARESKWVGFDLVGMDPNGFLAVEEEIKTRYTSEEVKAMRRHGFSGLPFKERADSIEATEMSNILYRNFSRNVHSTDYAEQLRLLGLEEDSGWDNFKDLRDAVGFSAAATLLWEMAHTATIIPTRETAIKIRLLINLDRVGAKFRGIESWVRFEPADAPTPEAELRVHT